MSLIQRQKDHNMITDDLGSFVHSIHYDMADYSLTILDLMSQTKSSFTYWILNSAYLEW